MKSSCPTSDSRFLKNTSKLAAFDDVEGMSEPYCFKHAHEVMRILPHACLGLHSPPGPR